MFSERDRRGKEVRSDTPELEDRVPSGHQVRLDLSSLDSEGNQRRMLSGKVRSTTTFDLELETREGHVSCESSIRLDLDLSDSERVLLDSS